MSRDWNWATVDEIKAQNAHAISMGPFGSDIKTDNFVAYGIPVIRGVNLSKRRFHEDGFVFISEEKANELKSANAYPGDIIFTHRGTLGQIGLIPSNSKYKRYVISQSQMKLTCDSAKVDPLFVFYYFRSPVGQRELLKHTSTTGVPALSHPLTSLKSIRVPLPPIVEQRAIANVLDCMDAKIELNDKINATLEAAAQAIFKHWFIDFEFPNGDEEPYKSSGGEMRPTELGEIPQGWGVSGVDSIADYINGKAFTAHATQRGRPIIKIAELKSGIKTTTKKYGGQADPSNIAYFDDILFSWSASLDLFRWWGEESVINQHIFKVIPKRHFTKLFIYYTLKSVMPHFQSIASTKVTTMGHIKRHHLSDEKVVIPPKVIIKKFEETAGPFYYMIAPNSRENGILSRLRDKILPQLLSGAIKASTTQKKTIRSGASAQDERYQSLKRII